MTYELTNEDKAGVINQHLKTLSYNKFNLELSKIEESAKTSPDSGILSDLTSQISEVNTKIDALLEELDKVN
jgi:hypothetical protein